MRGTCRADRVHLVFGDSVRTTLVILGLLLLSSFGHGKSDFSKKDADPQQPPSSLCPTGCTCTEQKVKLAQADQDLAFMDDEPDPNSNISLQKSKGKSEILKNGVRMLCQNPALGSLKKLSIPDLLAENVVQLDLSGSGLTKLSPTDFSSSYPMLQKLIFKNNQIRDIMPGTFSMMKSLKYLDLSNNQLVNFSSNVFGETGSMERIKLNGNLLNCDCHLGELLTFVSSHNIKVQGWCAEPAKLKDRPLARLVLEELTCPTEDPVTVEMKPNTNQIVFEGDPLRLGCRLRTGRPVSVTWQHKAANQTVATVTASNVVELSSTSRESPEGSGIFVTDGQLQIRHLLLRYGGTWTCSWGGRSASVEVTVLSLTTPTCASQATTSNKGRYAWPRTMANLKVALPCQANSNAQAFRLCGNNGVWEEPDVNSCYYLSEVTKVLEQFAKTNLTFSKTSALESARRLKSYLTDVASLTDPHEAVFVTQTLHNYLEASTKHPELLPIIMDVYTILLKQDSAVLADSRHGLVTLLQQAPLKTPEFEYQSFGLAVEKCGVALPQPGKPSAGMCVWRRASELPSGSASAKISRNRFQASCSPPSSNASGSVEASAWIPFTADGAASGFDQQNVVLSLILSTNAFVSPTTKPYRPLATSVLGITSGHVTNLINRTVPFIITLRLVRHVSYGERLVGARWNQYMDQWSPEQCQTLKEDLENKMVTFQCCCGFGFFAAFTSQSDAEEVTVRARSNATSIPLPVQLLKLLPPPVYVGSVVGVLCHLTACLCYLVHGSRLKMTQPTRHALINGWLSLALLMTAFTLGVRPNLGKLPCQVVGLLLHYLTLCSLLWMVVNASSLYKHVTKSAGRTEPGDADSQSLMEEALGAGHEAPVKPALRFYLIGWGVPIIVVGIAGAIHLEQYYSPTVCFLAWTPALGAVGLPSAILILLILTFHLLSWGYFRHTTRLAAIQKQLAAQAASSSAEAAPAGSSQANQRELTTISGRMTAEKPPNVPKCGYVPLTGDGDGTSCPSNLTTQVTETSDLASVSSDQERIALLVSVTHQRGEAEGAQSANEGGASLHAGCSESERPLLVTSSASSDDRLEDGAPKTDVDDQGHSNPLMTSFTEDGDSKKMAASSVGAPSVMESTHDPVVLPPAAMMPQTPALPQTPAVDESDEKCTLSQLRGQVVFLVLFCLTWLSGLCVVIRPFRDVLPYDELLSALGYALLGAATGLYTVVFHVLTRADVSASCFGPQPQQSKGNALPSEPVPQSQASMPSSAEQPAQQHFSTLPRNGGVVPVAPEIPADEVDRPHRIVSLGGPVPDSMNVSIMDPAMLVNSFYDARQSKTARRFFQKQKLLQQMQNNHHQLTSHHQRHHRHSRHSSSAHSINNSAAFRSQSHSPIAEEALINASSSSKAKVSNVNIHVEMGAYDWHELQSRLSDSSSWTKSGKQMPARIDYRPGSASGRGPAPNSRTPSRNEIPLQVTAPPRSVSPEVHYPAPSSTRSNSSYKSDKRKRHGVHPRTPKRSRWDHQSEAGAVTTSTTEKPVYVFANNDYRERALAHGGPKDDALKTLTAARIKVMDDSTEDDGASYLKRETSV